jgi:hypothetical protein
MLNVPTCITSKARIERANQRSLAARDHEATPASRPKQDSWCAIIFVGDAPVDLTHLAQSVPVLLLDVSAPSGATAFSVL